MIINHTICIYIILYIMYWQLLHTKEGFLKLYLNFALKDKNSSIFMYKCSDHREHTLYFDDTWLLLPNLHLQVYSYTPCKTCFQ